MLLKLATHVSTNPLQFSNEPLKMFTTSFNGSPLRHAVMETSWAHGAGRLNSLSFWAEHDPTEKQIPILHFQFCLSDTSPMETTCRSMMIGSNTHSN